MWQAGSRFEPSRRRGRSPYDASRLLIDCAAILIGTTDERDLQGGGRLAVVHMVRDCDALDAADAGRGRSADLRSRFLAAHFRRDEIECRLPLGRRLRRLLSEQNPAAACQPVHRRPRPVRRTGCRGAGPQHACGGARRPPCRACRCRRCTSRMDFGHGGWRTRGSTGRFPAPTSPAPGATTIAAS